MFYKNIAKHDKLKKLIEEGRTVQVTIVENALFKRAVGCEVTESIEETAGEGNEKYVVKTIRKIKQLPPDVGAIIFYLKNRASKDWQDRRTLDVKDDIFDDGMIEAIGAKINKKKSLALVEPNTFNKND